MYRLESEVIERSELGNLDRVDPVDYHDDGDDYTPQSPPPYNQLSSNAPPVPPRARVSMRPKHTELLLGKLFTIPETFRLVTNN